MAGANPKFMNSVPQVIRLRPPKRMAVFCQPFDSDDAFVSCPGAYMTGIARPFEQRT